MIYPTGTGSPRELPAHGIRSIKAVSFQKDGKSLIFIGSEGEKEDRVWVQSLDGSAPKPVTPEGVTGLDTWPFLSPDGRSFLAREKAGWGILDLGPPYGLFERHWAVFVLAQLAVVAAWLALEVAVVALHRSRIPASVGFAAWLVLHLCFLWVFCGLMAGIYTMALRAIDGGVPTFTTALGRFDRGRGYLVASLLYWAAVLVGLCLAVVPGVIVAVRWGLFRCFFAEESHSALASLHEAAALSTGHRWRLFRLLVLSAGLNLAGAAVLGLGLLVAFPVTVLLRAGAFRALQREKAAMSGGNRRTR